MEGIAYMLAKSAYYSLEDPTVRHPERHSVLYGTQDAHKREPNRKGDNPSGETENHPRGYPISKDRAE